MFNYKAQVIRVVDGDTLVVKIDIGFSTSVKKTLRVARVDAYETRLGKKTTPAQKKKGLAGKAYLQTFIEGKEVEVTTFKDKGKYGRYIADVEYMDTDISDEMVRRGYAVYKKY